MTEKEYGKIIDIKFNFYLIIIAGLISLIFINEELISKNEMLKNLMNFISNILPGFEYFALKSQYAGLYYFAKFQLSLSVVLSFVITLITFKKIKKIYKCSWGDNYYGKKYYFSEKIHKNGYFNSTGRQVGIVIFITLVTITYLFGLPFNNTPKPADVLLLKIVYNTKIGLISFTMAYAYMFGTLFPEIVMEIIGRIKYYNKKIGVR